MRTLNGSRGASYAGLQFRRDALVEEEAAFDRLFYAGMFNIICFFQQRT